MAKNPKHILITGTSTGIGYNAAEALCARGHHVWAALRKPEILDRLQEKYPRNLHVLKMDVTVENDIIAAYQMISAEVGNAEFILINNAGIAVGGPQEALPLDEWRRVFEVNVFAVINVTKIFLPLIRKSKGRVINISSISAHMASPFLGPYVASKFALRGLTDSLRREVINLGVKVISIEPGPIRTEIWAKSLRTSESHEKKLSPELQKTYGPLLRATQITVEKAAKEAVPVELVSKKIICAVEDRWPNISYLVGKAIHTQALLVKVLPARMADKIINRGLKKSAPEIPW